MRADHFDGGAVPHVLLQPRAERGAAHSCGPGRSIGKVLAGLGCAGAEPWIWPDGAAANSPVSGGEQKLPVGEMV